MLLKWSIYIFLLFAACASKEDAKSTTTSLTEANILPVEAQFNIADYDTLKWLELIDVEPTIVIEIKYATADNFVGEKMYDCGRCFLRPEAARRIAKAQRSLSAKGYGLKLFDCYRPRPFQQRLWDKVPDARYVTPPQKGSMHNRGLAVDITIVDSDGNELDMGTGYDFFGKEAYQDYKGHGEQIAQNRALLNSTMADIGFSPIRTEWWHFSLRGISYDLSDWIWPCK